MNLFDNMHGLKGCIRCLTFKNVLLAHFLLAFSVAGSVSAEALPTSYLNGIEQQSRKVAGRVLQRVDNEPVIGANIVVTGTTIGTITDVEGRFSLDNLPANARTLTVSFVGMTSQTLPIKSEMMILLEDDSETLDEVMGDDLVYTYSNAQFQKQAQWSSHRNATIGSATHFYRLLQYFISNSSMIIDNIDAAEGLESERNYIKGQAHFYRAFAYFTMVQMYGGRYKAEGDNTQLGVVIRNDNSTEPRARASVEEVYTRINEDIDLAIQLLGATEEKRTNKSHIDLHVARGLKARILLTQGKWLEAAEMAKLVVDLSGAKLQDDTYTTLNDRFSDQSNTEWLWGSNPLLQQAPNLTHFHGYMSNEIISYNGNTPRAIYNKLYDKISDTDVRKGIWFPRATDPNTLPRPIRAECNSKAYANYMANKFIVSDPTTKGGRDVPFMRLPEMMLIMAEGYARAGEPGKAAQALYPLASHRDPEYTLSTKTGENLIEEVMTQRRIELWGEGFRWFDLKRLNMDLDRGPAPRPEVFPNGLIEYWNKDAMPKVVDPEASNYNMYGDGTVTGNGNRYRPAGHRDWQWAIPDKETQLNPLCEPNP